jgi:protein phosphatase
MMPPFEAAASASQGAREYQEDAAAVWPGGESLIARPVGPAEDGRLLAVLADGMGGHAGGALASNTVCETFIEGFARETGEVRDRLKAGLDVANRAIELKVEANQRLSGMGSTLIGASFGPEGLQWISVGDSPLYLYRQGSVALVNEDHSLAPMLDMLAASGKITEEQAKSDPRRHMLRSAVTGEELDMVDLSQQALPVEPGDYVILASDGIHTLDGGEIARVVAAYAGDGPQAVAAALVRAVEAARDPFQDNITVVAVRRAVGETDQANPRHQT